MSTITRHHTLFLAAVASAAALALSGCALSPVTTASDPVAVQGSAFHGSVHGGQQPVTGSTIQLYAAGSTGYGSGFPYTTGSSLLGTNVVTTSPAGPSPLPAFSPVLRHRRLSISLPLAATPAWVREPTTPASP